MGVSPASAMHVSGPPGWADFGHRWSSGETFASGRQGPGANCVLTISACFISYGFLTWWPTPGNGMGCRRRQRCLRQRKSGGMRDFLITARRASHGAGPREGGRLPGGLISWASGLHDRCACLSPPPKQVGGHGSACASPKRTLSALPLAAWDAGSRDLAHVYEPTPAFPTWGRVRTLRVFLNGPRHRGSCGIRKSFQPPEPGGRRLREVAGVDRESQEWKRPSGIGC